MNTVDNPLLDDVRFDAQGLVCAVVQDVHSRRVLMVAWMNETALRATLATGFAHYYSRSRRKQWMKGESSGHVQKVHHMCLDCDGDALLLLIEQSGGIACHTGRESCFYRRWQDGGWLSVDAVLKDEADIYGKHTEKP